MCSVLFLGARVMREVKFYSLHFFPVFSEFSMMSEREPIRLIKRKETESLVQRENGVVHLK